VVEHSTTSTIALLCICDNSRHFCDCLLLHTSSFVAYIATVYAQLERPLRVVTRTPATSLCTTDTDACVRRILLSQCWLYISTCYDIDSCRSATQYIVCGSTITCMHDIGYAAQNAHISAMHRTRLIYSTRCFRKVVMPRCYNCTSKLQLYTAERSAEQH
jgi:hypothetical protein